MIHKHLRPLFCVVVLFLFVTSGCRNESPVPGDTVFDDSLATEIESYRERFLLASMPEGDVYTPSDVQAWASDDEISDPPAELPDDIQVSVVDEDESSDDNETSNESESSGEADEPSADESDDESESGSTTEESAESSDEPNDETTEKDSVVTNDDAESLTSDTATNPGEGEILIAGRIGAGDLEPFQPGEASFVISQLPNEEHAGGDPDHVDNCPFCKRKLAQAPKAAIRFANSDGETLKIDAQKLFGVKKDDKVVVRGEASYNATLRTVMVDATGVFISPQ